MPVTGQDTLLMVNELDLSKFLKDSSLNFDVALHASTTYGSSWRTYTPGLFGASLSFGGFAEEDFDDPVLEDFNAGAGVYATYARERTAGSRAFVLQPRYGSVGFTDPVDGLVECVGNLTASGKRTSLGWLLTAGIGTESGSGSAETFDGPSVDVGETTGGGFAVLHLQKFGKQDGTSPDVEFKIQHRSTTVAGWSDHSTFATDPSAAGVYVLELAGTIRRHVRVVLAFTAGIADAAFVVSLAHSPTS